MSDNGNGKCMALVPTNINEVQTLAKTFAMSALLPQALRGKEADVAVVIMTGMEMGLPPMTALRMIDVIQGKGVLNAAGMVARVKQLGLDQFFRPVESESDETKATYETKRKDDTVVHRGVFTIEQARDQGLLNKANWKSDPVSMLKARAKSRLARDVYPEVLGGIYDPDEADEIREDAPEPKAIDAEFTSVDTAPDEPPPGEPDCAEPEPISPQVDLLCADFIGATTREEVTAIGVRCKGLTGENRQVTVAAYKSAWVRVTGNVAS